MMKQEFNHALLTHLSTSSLANFLFTLISSSDFDKNIITCQDNTNQSKKYLYFYFYILYVVGESLPKCN